MLGGLTERTVAAARRRLSALVLRGIVFALLGVALSFALAAVFVALVQAYGGIIACSVFAGMFLLAAVAVAVTLWLVEQRNKALAARDAYEMKMMTGSLLRAPAAFLGGLGAGGVLRFLPLALLGGVALGFLSRAAKPRSRRG